MIAGLTLTAGLVPARGACPPGSHLTDCGADGPGWAASGRCAILRVGTLRVRHMSASQRQRVLVEALLDPARYPHPCDVVEHRETHISHVLLAGEFAYKIKKPLDLGFLDFTRLADRAHYCAEEVRLNARLAPSVYLDAIPITGTPEAPALGGTGEAIEHAVRMRRFDEAGLLDRALDEGRVDRALATDLARRIARFHEAADADPPDAAFGAPEAVVEPMRQNFVQLGTRLDDALRARLAPLAAWTEARFGALRQRLAQRRAEGRVRECHGDMHLGNIALVEGEPVIFDGIEFNAAMRWTDVAADIAFLAMDLDSRGAPGLAGVFLDTWLAETGDYDALAVLRFYLVYRALVRAKIAAIRMCQDIGAAAAERARRELETYLALAERYVGAAAPAVVLTRGVAGTGKSTAAAALVERIGAIRLRSDVERRRLYPDPDPAHRYAPAAHDAVYARLEALATRAVAAGYPVVIDATFLERSRRAPFVALARRRGIPLRILDLDVPDATAIDRIRRRRQAGSDPSEADQRVMQAQRARLEPLDEVEQAARLVVENDGYKPLVPPTGLSHARGFAPDDPDPSR